MKKMLLTVILAITTLFIAGCATPSGYLNYPPEIIGLHCCHEGEQDVQPLSLPRMGPIDDDTVNTEDDRSRKVTNEVIKIGVTRPSHDNVGQILNFFGAGMDFYEVTATDLRNLERLSRFYAVFINCGSHDDVEPRVLRSYVAQGGIVYASDLAGSPLITAFPGIFEYRVIDPSLTVRDASIPHASLASHMRISELDVIFNMGGWYVITELSEDATIYIEGYVPRRGVAPLAISFEYGDGTVFYTSFHNNAQATSHMINFIEYLVFRIKFIEADRTQSLRAASEGFDFQGQVFGFFARSSSPAGMSAATPSLSVAMDSADSEAMAMAPAPQAADQNFQYTFNQGESFMLMVEAGGASFTLRLYDPNGNIYYLSQRGQLISSDLISGGPAVPPIFETIEGDGVRVRNVTGGEWRFTIIADDAATDTVFAIGIAVQAP